MRRAALTLVLFACSRTELDAIGSEPSEAGEASTEVDASIEETSVDAAHDTSPPWPDAALALACRDVTRIIHVDTDGGFGLDASSTITGDVGTWTSLFSQDLFFEVHADSDASWAVAGESDWQNGQGLDAGTYTSSGDGHLGWWIQVEADNHACWKIPTGTFTIYDISALDEQTLSKLLVTFDLECAGQGSLTGCARFER